MKKEQKRIYINVPNLKNALKSHAINCEGASPTELDNGLLDSIYESILEEIECMANIKGLKIKERNITNPFNALMVIEGRSIRKLKALKAIIKTENNRTIKTQNDTLTIVYVSNDFSAGLPPVNLPRIDLLPEEAENKKEEIKFIWDRLPTYLPRIKVQLSKSQIKELEKAQIKNTKSHDCNLDGSNIVENRKLKTRQKETKAQFLVFLFKNFKIDFFNDLNEKDGISSFEFITKFDGKICHSFMFNNNLKLKVYENVFIGDNGAINRAEQLRIILGMATMLKVQNKI